jgi:hypothetical protein
MSAPKSPFEIRLDIIKQAYTMVVENTPTDTPLREVAEKTFAVAADIKAFVDKS